MNDINFAQYVITGLNKIPFIIKEGKKSKFKKGFLCLHCTILKLSYRAIKRVLSIELLNKLFFIYFEKQLNLKREQFAEMTLRA